jgi:hypothetical protein
MQRGNVAMLQFNLALIRGRSTGLPLPDLWLGAGPDAQRVIDALFVGGDPAPAAPAAAALERAIGTPLGDDCCLDRFLAGESALESGRLSAARRAMSDLERVGRPGRDTTAALATPRAYAAILAAQLATRDASRSATDRLRQLDSILTDPRGEPAWVHQIGNLIAARLHEGRREFGDALGAIRRRDWTENAPIYVTYHREEGRMAVEAGDTAGAILAYRRYLGIRGESEPRLQPEVQRVRAELAALDRAR